MDISKLALIQAKENAELLNASVKFIQADIFVMILSQYGLL